MTLPPRPDPMHDCPPARRSPLPPGYTCRLLAPAAPGIRQAGVRNVSSSGVGLILGEPLPVGADLVLELEDCTPVLRGVVGAQVRHSTPQPGGHWLVGCSVTRPGSLAEARQLLEALAAAR